jgi:hypothetical protein
VTIPQTKKRDPSSGLYPSKGKTVIQQVCQSDLKCAKRDAKYSSQVMTVSRND